MYIKRDPGDCIVCSAVHTTCVAAGSDSATIIAGPITPATEIVVPTSTSAPAPSSDTPAPTSPTQPPDSTFSTSSYRRKKGAS